MSKTSMHAMDEDAMTTAIELRLFQAGDEAAFRELNEAWIAKYFGIEAHDNEMLGDPVGYVIEPGGQICVGVVDGRVIGCCALILMRPGVYEVAKMAVAEECRGLGVGRKVLAYTIEQARAMGATALFLETNHVLENAIHLYESLGFKHLVHKGSAYARSDVQMELELV